MALGDSIKRSQPWQLLHADDKRSSIHPLNLSEASLRKEYVNIPFSTQMRISSAGSPSTGAKSIPCFLIHGSNSACVAIFGMCPSASSPLQSAMYGCTSPREPMVRQVIRRGSVGLKLMIEAR